jgi:hypothetical protein
MFLAWQFAVCISIVFVGSFSLPAKKLLSTGWILWTLIMVLPVYPLWVGAIQIANIVLTYNVSNSIIKEKP